MWQQRFNRDPSVLGQALTLNGAPYTIVGVAPKGFTGMSLTRTSAFIPLTSGAWELFTPRTGRPPWYQGYNFTWMEMIARRKTGVTAEAANTDLRSALAAAASEARTRSIRPEQLILVLKEILAEVTRELPPLQPTDEEAAQTVLVEQLARRGVDVGRHVREIEANLLEL